MMKKLLGAMFAVVVGSSAAGIGPVASAKAADLTAPIEPVVAPAPAETRDWRFQATLYGWLSGLNGDVGAGGLGPVSVDMTPSDVLSNLKGALMASFGATNGEWLLLADAMLARLGDDGQIGNSRFNYDFTQNQVTLQGAVGYVLPINVENLKIAPTVGFRYMNQNTELSIGTDRFPDLDQRSVTEQWIDPTVGVTLRYDINDKWFVNALGDVGGFGVGSKFTWQAFAAVGYNWSKTISTSIGYRAIYEDYENDGYVYDATQHGVFVGLGIHF